MTTVAQELQQLWQHNKAFFGEVERKIQIQRAGGLYRARYEGESTSCLGFTQQEAKKKLEFWRDHGKA